MAQVVLKLGSNVSTDVIFPGRFMATVLPTETPRFTFADDSEFNSRLNNREFAPSSVIVADDNFGCGSSREQAASCLQGAGFTVVAKGFARIFLQNAINLGLRTVICPQIEANVGDELEVGDAHVDNRTTGRTFDVEPLPQARRAIVDAGGLIPYTRRRLIGK